MHSFKGATQKYDKDFEWALDINISQDWQSTYVLTPITRPSKTDLGSTQKSKTGWKELRHNIMHGVKYFFSTYIITNETNLCWYELLFSKKKTSTTYPLKCNGLAEKRQNSPIFTNFVWQMLFLHKICCLWFLMLKGSRPKLFGAQLSTFFHLIMT